MIGAEIVGIEGLVNKLASLPAHIEAGVKVTGEATEYATIWEWGKISVKPGPKTMYSTNPKGEERVLTITAPHGWIRTNRDRYQQLLREKLDAVNFSGDPSGWGKLVEQAMMEAAEGSKEIMVDTAPEDTGLLKSSLDVVPPGDPLLQAEDQYELGINYG